MSIIFYILFLTTILLTRTTQGQTEMSKPEFTNEITLGEDFKLRWVGNDSAYLVMEMSAPAKGYVAIGFSPDGGMNNSDIIMGWVDSTGKAYLKDLHGVGNTKPVEDPDQNVELISGEETDTITKITFRRRWRTCDDIHDIRVDETQRLIWAYNKEDPMLADAEGAFKPPYHFTSRGAGALEDQKAKVRIPDVYISDHCMTPWTGESTSVKPAP